MIEEELEEITFDDAEDLFREYINENSQIDIIGYSNLSAAEILEDYYYSAYQSEFNEWVEANGYIVVED